MADQLFVSQEKLESWVEEGKVSFEDNLLTLLARKVTYRLEPAVRVTELLDGEDLKGLVGNIYSVAQIEQMGGESYGGSIILGETAYNCEDGFVGNEQVATGTSEEPKAEPPQEGEQSDSDLLADFLLKHL